MSEEYAFRIALAVVFSAALAGWVRNLLRAGVTRDIFYGPAEGLLVAIPIRVLVGLSLFGIVADQPLTRIESPGRRHGNLTVAEPAPRRTRPRQAG